MGPAYAATLCQRFIIIGMVVAIATVFGAIAMMEQVTVVTDSGALHRENGTAVPGFSDVARDSCRARPCSENDGESDSCLPSCFIWLPITFRLVAN